MVRWFGGAMAEEACWWNEGCASEDRGEYDGPAGW